MTLCRNRLVAFWKTKKIIKTASNVLLVPQVLYRANRLLTTLSWSMPNTSIPRKDWVLELPVPFQTLHSILEESWKTVGSLFLLYPLQKLLKVYVTQYVLNGELPNQINSRRLVQKLLRRECTTIFANTTFIMGICT